MKKFFCSVFVIVVTSLVVFTSCDDATTSSGFDTQSETLASVSFVVSCDDFSKTIAPKPALMAVSRYSVQGTSSSGSSFGPVFSTDSNIAVDGILPGTWNILAKAYNSNGNELARGEVKIVLQNGSNRASVPLDTILGVGTAQLALSWQDAISADSKLKINAVFESSAGDKYQDTLEVSTKDCKATLKRNLSAGSYVLTVKVSDSSGIIYGFAEAVRIVSGETSIGVVTLDGVSAQLDVSLINLVGTPLPVYVQCTPMGSNYLLRACCDTLPANVASSSLSYLWFCNGSAVGFSKDLTATSSTSSGCRYDVIVSSSVLGTTGSASITM